MRWIPRGHRGRLQDFVGDNPDDGRHANCRTCRAVRDLEATNRVTAVIAFVASRRDRAARPRPSL